MTVSTIDDLSEGHYSGGSNITGEKAEALRALLRKLISMNNDIQEAAGAAKIPLRNAAGDVIVPSTPGSLTAAASKGYTDAAILAAIYAVDIKDNVKAASTAPLTHSGAQTIDGVSCVAGDRVLDKDHGTGALRGIWIVAAGAWTRALDMAAGSAASGALIEVDQGTANAERIFHCTNSKGSDVVGTDALVFVDASVSINHEYLAGLLGGGSDGRYHIGPAQRGTFVVKVAAVGNLTLSGAQTIDGIVCAAGDYVLATLQTTPAEHGVYKVAAGAWSRASGLATGASASGARVHVDQGTSVNRDFVCTNALGADVVGTDTLVFVDASTLGSHAAATAKAGHTGGAGDHTHVSAGAEGGTLNLALATIAGQRPVHMVRAASTGDLALTGEQTVDTIALVAGDRVLAKNQAAPAEKGIYVVAAAGWTRAVDFPAGMAAGGMLIQCVEGTATPDTLFKVTNDKGADIVGTNDLIFVACPITNAVAGVGPGYILARGQATLLNGGGGTLVVATGLTAIVAAVCTLAVDPAVTECTTVSQTWAAGNLTIKGWMPTVAGAGGNADPVAATPPGGGTKVDWIAVGT